jgi:endoglycosylceramidase
MYRLAAARSNATLPLFAFVVLALGCSSPPSHSAAPVYPSGGRLVDQQGRSVVLRGVNIRAAGFFDDHYTHLPLPPFSGDDCRVMAQDLGMSSLRLPISWSYLEPSPGNFDQAYVAKILQLAADCAAQGIYTYVDLHQDGWSKYVGDDGAPFWAHNPPLPASLMDESGGGQGAISAAVQAAFNGFFNDTAGLVKSYASMAGRLAKIIDKQPGIIGLELMNEPTASPDQLANFDNVVGLAVRAAAPGLPIFFEPIAVRNVLDTASPDPLPVQNTVYTPHLYTGVFQNNWMIGQTSRIENSIQGMISEASSVNSALMVTEFGNDPTNAKGLAWLGDALNLMDQYVVSWSFWVYEEWPCCWGLYDEAPIAGQPAYTRTLRPAATALLARPYPLAIAGTVDSFAYDQPSRTLTVQMHGASGTHVLAAPGLVYSGNVAVTCDGHAVAASRNGSRVSVQCAGKTLIMSPAN